MLRPVGLGVGAEERGDSGIARLFLPDRGDLDRRCPAEPQELDTPFGRAAWTAALSGTIATPMPQATTASWVTIERATLVTTGEKPLSRQHVTTLSW